MPGEQVSAAYAKISLDTKDFESGMSGAHSKFGSFADGIEGRAGKMGSAIGNALKVGLVAGTVAIGAALVGGTKAFADYESGLASVSKTTGLTGDALKSLGNDLRSLATAGPTTVAELEKIASSAGSLGIGAAKMASGDLAGAKAEIMSFTKTMSDMAIAFEMDVETVATSMADIGNVYKIPTEGLGELGSQINVLENTMSATAPQIIDFMGAFGGTASLFGESAASTAAFGATLSQLGVKGSEASTQLRSGILQLTQATNVSEAKIKAFAKSAGISVEEAQKQMANGQQNIAAMARLMGISATDLADMLDKDLYGTMIKMGKAFKGIEGDTKKAAEAQKIFGAYGYSALIKLGDGAEIYSDALGKVQVKGDELTKEAGTMANTINGQWQRMKNGVNDVGISIGEITSGPLKNFMAFMNDQAIPAAKEFIEALAKGDWDKVKEVFSDVIDFLKEKLESIGEYIKNLPWPEWIKAAGEALINAPWGTWAKQAIDILSKAAKSAISTAMDIGGWIYDKLQGWINGNNPKKLGESIVTAIATAIKDWLGSDISIWGALSKVWGTAKDWLSMGWEIIKGIGSGIIGKIQEYLMPAQNSFVDWVKAVGNLFFDLGKTITTALVSGLQGAGTALDNFLTKLGQNVPGMASTLRGTVDGHSTTADTRILTGLKSDASQKYAVKVGIGYKYFSTEKGALDYLKSTTPGTASVTGASSWGTSTLSPYDLYKQKQGSVNTTGLKETIGGYLGWETTEQADKKSTESTKELTVPINADTVNFNGGTADVSQEGRSSEKTEAWNKGYSNPADLQMEKVDKNYTSTIFKDFLKGLDADIDARKIAWNTEMDGRKWKIAEEKTATKENIAVTKTATELATQKTQAMLSSMATAVGDITQNVARSVDKTMTFGAKTVSDALTSAAATATQAAKNAENILVGGSQVAANAIRLGGEVAANFATQGGQAVKIGLDASGREIAVIGQVAQQRFTQAGGELYSKVQVAGGDLVAKGVTTGTSLTIGGISAQTAMQTGANSVGSALQSGANAIGSAASKLMGFDANALLKSTFGSITPATFSSTPLTTTTSTSTSTPTGGLWSWGGKPKGMASGHKTTGPQFALIGEDGPTNPEFVIPTKTKRWDLLLAAMRSYGIPGYAEGTSTGSTSSEGADAPPMQATFGIIGLANMSKDVKKIISDLKDFFRISWGIIKAEGATYWKAINAVINAEVTATRDAAWQGALDIRNTWITGNAAILADVTTSYAAMWPAISPSMMSLHDGIISSFNDAKTQATYALQLMNSDCIAAMQSFKTAWDGVWVQMMGEFQATVSQIQTILEQLGASLGNIQINANVNVNSSGGGSSGGSSGSGSGSTDGVFGGWLDPTGDWSDMGGGSGGTGSIGSVAASNPGGILPSGIFGGASVNTPTVTVTGATKIQCAGGCEDFTQASIDSRGPLWNVPGTQTVTSSSGGYSGGNSGYSLPSIFRSAGGALFGNPSVTKVAENGPEMVLPTPLTRMFLSLADAGIGQGAGNGSRPIVIEDHTVHHWYMDSKEVTKQVMKGTVKQLKLRGAIAIV